MDTGHSQWILEAIGHPSVPSSSGGGGPQRLEDLTVHLGLVGNVSSVAVDAFKLFRSVLDKGVQRPSTAYQVGMSRPK